MRFAVDLVFFLCCVSTVLAVEHIITGDFVETRNSAGFENGYLIGKFYYYYNSENDGSASRLRLKYSVLSGSSTMTVSNLYHYEYKALYSMCSTCKAETIKERPDPWWYDSNVYQSQSGGWYKRKTRTDSNSPQVSRIKMASHVSPSATSIEIIEFEDGRTMEVSNVKVGSATGLTKNSAEFKVDSGITCPTPTCSMLADIVFVLDYSGSVNSTEWTQQSNFVIGVMNNFTFGDTAAAAACIQFNAPSSGYSSGSGRYVKCYDNPSTPGTIYRYYTDFNYTRSTKTPSNTASVLAGQKVGDKYTVSTLKEPLINEMKKTRSPRGNTCQGFGLELAMEVFDLSPRNKYGNRLNRIVIAVTDGADHCPNRTQRAAKKLREEYDALFIGVGVGLSCDYDRRFISNLSSVLAGEPTYFPVDDYASIRTLVDKLFTPLCSEYHETECGPDCKGFCACGDCFCPNCRTTGNLCSDNKCVARDGTASGCVDTVNKSACPASDKCVQYQCHHDGGSGLPQCTKTETCSVVASMNQGTCHTTTCNNGKCIVKTNDDLCKLEMPYSKCEEWRCAGENKSANDYAKGDFDPRTGCYRYKNVHQACADKGKNKCAKYTCNSTTGQCDATDLCKSDMCTKRECPKDSNGEYGQYCTNSSVPSPDTACARYSCHPVDGWTISENKTKEKCAAELFPKEEDRRCKDFDCHPKKGCVYEEYPEEECELCTDEIKRGCVEKAQMKSTVDKCYVGKCKLRNNATDAYCNIDNEDEPQNITDCTTSDAANQAREINEKDVNSCFTVSCMAGLCKVVPVGSKPREDDRCIKHVCKEYRTGQWRWEEAPTEEAMKCKTDACFNRTCDPVEGCKEEDICGIYSNECTLYECATDESGAPACESRSLLEEHSCMFEICDEKEGKKIQIFLEGEELAEACPNDDPCLVMMCGEDGECANKTKIALAQKEDDDPCKVWTCNSTTGEVNWKEKCDDGKYCTKNLCSFDGSSCTFSPINCYLEVNMTDYPCFRAECVESAETESYRCMRKLKSGVYVDICGNCLRDFIPTSSDSESYPEAEESCIEAPEDPMLKEGLAAASIALIVLGAIIIGGAMAASGVIGTRTLLERARAANNQSAHTNPLFEDNEAEMTNPTFVDDKEM